jgi:hypothetical protein
MKLIPYYVIYFVGFISAVLFVLCAIFYSSHKSLFIWLLFFGIVSGLLAGFLHWQNHVWQKEESIADKSAEKTPRKNDSLDDQKNPLINAPNSVVSINQQGGITAGTVNVNIKPAQRQLPIEILHKQLAPFSGMRAFFHWRADDNESSIFTENLEKCLIKSGWLATRSVAHIADASMSNVVIEINDKLASLDKTNEAASSLARLLKNQNIAVSITKNSNNPLPANAMYIRVGPIR